MYICKKTMKPTFITYYNNQKLGNKHSDNLSRSIFELGLKKGDTITSYSFNHFDDEETDFKPEKLPYQDVILEIENIQIKLIDTWNSNIRSVVEIFLCERVMKNKESINIMVSEGDFVKEIGSDWVKVLKIDGRNIYLDYDDGLNCLDIDDIIEWKH